jgi:positive regulator of sigma E activity
LMHGNPIMNVKFGHSTRHEKFVFFKGTYLYTIVFPLLLLLVTCINAFIYTITFNDKRIYDITNIWLIIFAFNMISNFIEKLSHFARNGKIKDFLKFYWIAGRIDTLSMYVFRKSIWSLFRSVFLRRKQKAFNRTAKFRKNDNSEEIHMLLKMALINWLWFVIGLIISIILVKCYFSIEHSALYGTLCVLIFVWVCWPNLWKVIFCFISTMRYKAKKETKYFDILNKFNKIRSKYGFELIK